MFLQTRAVCFINMVVMVGSALMQTETTVSEDKADVDRVGGYFVQFSPEDYSDQEEEEVQTTAANESNTEAIQLEMVDSKADEWHLATSDRSSAPSLFAQWSVLVAILLVPVFVLAVLYVSNHTIDQTPMGTLNLHDPCLLSNASPTKCVVHKLSRPVALLDTVGGQEHNLDPSVCTVNPTNGQLYDPNSGLVFNAIHEFVFQPDRRMNVHILTSGRAEPQPNQVYNRDTNKLYEKCLALGFQVETGQYFVPHLPTVRRVLPRELPPQIDAAFYIDKLKNTPYW